MKRRKFPFHTWTGAPFFSALPTHCHWFSTNPLTTVYCSRSATALRLWRPTPGCVAPHSAPSVFPLTQEGSQGSSFSSFPLCWGKVEPREKLRARSIIIYIVRLAGSAALKLVLWLGDCIPCAPEDTGLHTLAFFWLEMPTDGRSRGLCNGHGLMTNDAVLTVEDNIWTDSFRGDLPPKKTKKDSSLVRPGILIIDETEHD